MTLKNIKVTDNVKSQLDDLAYEKETYNVTNKLFLSRRKTILNNLSQLINKDEAIKILETLNIGVILRPEEISPVEFYKLTRLLLEKGYKNV